MPPDLGGNHPRNKRQPFAINADPQAHLLDIAIRTHPLLREQPRAAGPQMERGHGSVIRLLDVIVEHSRCRSAARREVDSGIDPRIRGWIWQSTPALPGWVPACGR